MGYTSKGVDKGRDFRIGQDLTNWIVLCVKLADLDLRFSECPSLKSSRLA